MAAVRQCMKQGQKSDECDVHSTFGALSCNDEQQIHQKQIGTLGLLAALVLSELVRSDNMIYLLKHCFLRTPMVITMCDVPSLRKSDLGRTSRCFSGID